MTLLATIKRLQRKYQVTEASIEGNSVSYWIGNHANVVALDDELQISIDTLMVIESKYYELINNLSGGDTLPCCKHEDMWLGGSTNTEIEQHKKCIPCLQELEAVSAFVWAEIKKRHDIPAQAEPCILLSDTKPYRWVLAWEALEAVGA